MTKLKKLKRVFVPLLVVALMATSIIALVACGNSNNPNGSNGNGSYELKAQDMYAMSAMTSIEYLAGNANSKKLSAVADVADFRPNGIDDSVVNELNNVVGMFEGILYNNGYTQEITTPTEADGEYKNYKTKVYMTIPSPNGGLIEYTMYYTEYDRNGTPVQALDFDDDDDDDKDEIEVETKLEGVAIYDGQVYNIYGKKEVERDGREVETELEFTTKIDNRNYITVSEEKENNEVEYVYAITENGFTTETAIEIEKERNKIVLKVEVEDDNNYEKEFKIVKEDGKTELIAFYELNDAKKKKIRIVPQENGSHKFIYDNGYSEIVESHAKPLN